ncbi:hypothetical protein GCM10010965_14630 [Caldalkalibacillus thermarum]|uniref:hypothetical protein n=1 Tax=Caldalkalibacillus thermarum TaxID=296745 RepID=UPI00166715FC|nr:hypothetical protein [Caldalkalibacillus thermarum]GGK22800.1 hypothetical protein GCM10010965_14630 [Caldalkalibacillus thermarum]
MVEKISLSIRKEILDLIDERGEARSSTINRDLERLYTLYRRALNVIEFGVNEACLITEALETKNMTAETAHLLWAYVEDALRHKHLSKVWNVDGSELVEKLRSLNEIQAMAVIDAVERFWTGFEKGKYRDMEKDVPKCFGLEEKSEKEKGNSERRY